MYPLSSLEKRGSWWKRVVGLVYQEHQKRILIVSTNLVLRAQKNPLLDKFSSYRFRKQELKMWGLHLTTISRYAMHKTNFSKQLFWCSSPHSMASKKYWPLPLWIYFSGATWKALSTQKMFGSCFIFGSEFWPQSQRTVTPDMIECKWQKDDYWLDMFRATNGAHIEIQKI